MDELASLQQVVCKKKKKVLARKEAFEFTLAEPTDKNLRQELIFPFFVSGSSASASNVEDC